MENKVKIDIVEKYSPIHKMHVSKNPSLEVISEAEPNSYNAQRINDNNHNRHSHIHVQMQDSINYNQSTSRLSPSNKDGRINQGYSGNSQSSINREGSTPSAGGYVTLRLSKQ